MAAMISLAPRKIRTANPNNSLRICGSFGPISAHDCECASIRHGVGMASLVVGLIIGLLSLFRSNILGQLNPN
ncbi:hypothetical protein niasHS_016796 [Heterodera schachtii]|uniref:Uncharacterized protein n=1 Tax=Heterodera schachtii TaxID=97005 RepID=A0ABD2HTB0_HETSC